MGFMTGDEAGQGKRLTLFLAWNYVVIYVLCEAMHGNAGKCKVRYLHEMTNYFLCMNPVKKSNNGSCLKQLHG